MTKQNQQQDAPKGSQRGQTTNQQGTGSPGDEVDESPEMNQASEKSSSEKLRQGALDAQYGTDSASKAGPGSQPQGSSQSTGSDRDTMTGSRSKDKDR